MPSTPQDTAPRRRRAASDDLRERLIEAALAEFSENGFEGASTRSIAARADAHQPQINYHFDSKEALWRAAVDHVMEDFDEVFTGLDATDARSVMADVICRLVHFAAEYPELHRIMIQEGTTDTDRLHWLVDTHIRPRHELVTGLWDDAVAAGVAAPVGTAMIHYLLLGSATLLFTNAPEARLVLGAEPTDPAMVDEYADTLVGVLLPEEN